MNIHIHRRLSIAILAASAAWAPLGYSQQTPQSTLPLQPATPEWEARALSRMANQPIRAANDEQLSTVADYLLEAETGQLRFVVVPSGSNTFRLVPMAALDPASGAQGLKLRIDRGRWEQVGTLTHDWLKERVSMDNAHRSRLAQQFGVTEPLPGQGTTAILVRASTLKGKTIQSGNEPLGTIEDVVLDLQSGYAWALLKASGGFAASGRHYLFPFDRMEIPAGGGAVTTAVTRNDFAQPGLMPTGFPSAAQGGQQLNGVASAVQQALQNVPSIPRGNVQVIPESRLVLRGSVESEQQKAEAYRVATQAAPGVRVDNELNVRSRWGF